ncbi:hypothetical protein [Streptomyces chartreusis]
MEFFGRDGFQQVLFRVDRLVRQEAVLILQVFPAAPVESAGRSQLGLLDGDQLAAVGYGLDVPEAAVLVDVAEVVSQRGTLIKRSEVRHALRFDALQVNYEIIVPASACGCTVLTSRSSHQRP